MGAQALGYYTFAYNLIVMPIRKINPILTRVAFPIMAKFKNDMQEVRKFYLDLLKILSLINFPILFGLAASANYAIIAVFGVQWKESILLVQILAGVGLFKTICNPIGALLYSQGRADKGFIWNVIVIATQLPGIYLGIHYGGYKGVAIAFLVLAVIQKILFYQYLIKPFFKNSLAAYLNSFLPAFWLSAIMGLMVVLVGSGMDGYNNLTVFSVQVAAGIATYLALIYFFERAVIGKYYGHHI